MYPSEMCCMHYLEIKSLQNGGVRLDLASRVDHGLILIPESLHYRVQIVPLPSIEADYAVFKGENNLVQLKEGCHTLYNDCDLK